MRKIICPIYVKIGFLSKVMIGSAEVMIEDKPDVRNVRIRRINLIKEASKITNEKTKQRRKE